MLPKKHLPTLSGHKIAYFDTEEYDKPPIVFIHGNSMCLDVFNDQLQSDALKAKFRLIALDLPGHGESAHPTDANVYSFVNLGNVVADMLKTLDLNNVTLVGCSLGGHIAIEMVNPQNTFEKTSCIAGICISGTPPISLESMEAMFKGFQFNPEISQLIMQPQFTREEAAKFITGGGIPVTEKNQFLVDYAINMDPNARPHIMGSAARYAHVNQIETVQKTTLPMLFIIGEKDSGINNEYLVETVTAANRLRKFVGSPEHEMKTFADASHATFYGATAAQFTEAVLTFATQHALSSAPENTVTAP